MLFALTVPQDAGLAGILTAAFAAGLLHALDGDHIAAVGGLTAGRAGWSASIRVAAAWATGHGLTLLAVGAFVYLLGIAIPDRLSTLAEWMVGGALIAIGLSALHQVVKRRAHLHTHAHRGLPTHAHLHAHDHDAPADHSQDLHRHDHRAVLVGVVHGAAGSAPILALIPLSQLGSAWIALAYLSVFGIGVLVAMVAFGGALGGLFAMGSAVSHRLVSAMQTLLGTLSVGLGVWWLAAA